MSAGEYSELTRSVHAIELAVGKITERLDRAIADGADHERRLRSLEAWRWKAAGAAAVIGAVSAALVQRLLG